MKDKLIRVALGVPQAYPWEREKMDIEKEEIDRLLKELNIDTFEKRRIAAWNIDRLIYLESTNSKSKEEIKTKILQTLRDEKYISEPAIDYILRGRRLNDETQIATYKNFVKNNMTIKEKQDNKNNIIIWLIDLLIFNEIEKNNKLDTDAVIKLAKEILDKHFHELEYTEKNIIGCLKRRGLLSKENIELFNKEFLKKCDGFSELLSKFLTLKQNESDNESTEKLTDSILDFLLNDMDSFEETEDDNNKKCSKEKVKVNNIKEKPAEINTNLEKDKMQNKIDKPKTNEDLVEKNLKALCQSLGYKLIKDNDKKIEEDNDLGMLKELALLKNRAVLSQLYNIYTNINNISLENIEAGLSDFFETLKLQGLEVDDTRSVGDEIEVNTDDILKKYVFSEATDKRGTVVGKIEYLQWNYKGKSVAPMIIKPNK